VSFISIRAGLGKRAQILMRAQQVDTNNLEVRLKLGTIYLGAGKLKEAGDEAASSWVKPPRTLKRPSCWLKPRRQIKSPKPVCACKNCRRPVETAPLEVALGVLSFRQGDLKTAEADFKRAATLDPKFSDGYSALGNLYVAQNDLKQADPAFKTAADLAPPRSGKALQYAKFKILTGDSAAGKLLLEDVVKKAPDYLPAWITLAQLDADDKKYADAVTLLGNVLSRDRRILRA